MKRIALILLLACWTLPSTSARAGDFTTRTVSIGQHKKMETALYVPNGAGPFPMVLVLHTSFGITEADRGYCGNLAREGYICAAPAFLRAYNITEELRRSAFTKDARSIAEDFVAIIGELDALPQAKRGAAGVVGFSNGGFFAALLASIHRVKAGVSYYGALDGARTHLDLDVFKTRWTRESAPMLVLAGDNDVVIGKQTPRLLEQIMKEAGAPYEVKYYPDAGHGFDRNSTSGAGNGAAAADAWPRTLRFLRANGV